MLIGETNTAEQDQTTLRRASLRDPKRGLFPHRTIVDNICTVPLLLASQAPARKNALALMTKVASTKTWPRSTRSSSPAANSSASGGPALPNPPVLLMDEPFAIDPVVRRSAT